MVAGPLAEQGGLVPLQSCGEEEVWESESQRQIQRQLAGCENEFLCELGFVG